MTTETHPEPATASEIGDGPATKADLLRLELRIERRFSGVEGRFGELGERLEKRFGELETLIQKVRGDLILWVVGSVLMSIFVTLISILVTVFKK